MLNNFVTVGRINNIELEDNKCMLALKVPRSYKNENGEYEDDLITIQVFNNLSDTLNEYCKAGDLVGIKGRIQSSNVLVAEKVTFLSSKEKD